MTEHYFINFVYCKKTIERNLSIKLRLCHSLSFVVLMGFQVKCVVMKIHFIKLVGRRGRCNDRTLFYKLRVL